MPRTGKECWQISEELSNKWKIYYYIDIRNFRSVITILATTCFVMGICLAAAAVLMNLISKILSSRVFQLKHCAEEVSREILI